MPIRAGLLSVVALLVAFGLAAAGSREVRIRVKGSKERVEPGSTGAVTVTLKNRTGETKQVELSLLVRDEAEAFETVTIDLAPKEKVTRDFDVPVPENWLDKRLSVIVSAADARAKGKIRTIPGEFTDELWLQGRELFRQECRSCHGSNGWKIRNLSLGAWITNSRNGPGSMPRFPHLSRTDLVLMRGYARDADRAVE